MDKGYGSCVLRNEWAREILLETIEYRNGIDYILIAMVIMPNHVHLLLEIIGNIDVSKIMHRIRRRSAREINKVLGKVGNLWSDTYHDRMIRGEDHYRYCINYIKDNPLNLSESDYYLFY